VVALYDLAMKLRQIWLASLLAANAFVAVPAHAVPDTAPASTSPALVQSTADDEGPPRLSLPTESDRAAWKKPGFRFGLGLAYARFVGIDGPPSGQFIGPTIRMGIRLDESWSLMGSFQYLFAFGKGGMGGARYAGTIEPTWHATAHLNVGVGIGFGGLVEPGSGRPDPPPPPGSLDVSYTFPNARTPLSSCDGVGVTGLLRAEWLYVLGPRASMGVALEADDQWTACVENTGNLEPDTATAIVRRQWWSHLGGSLSWVTLWR
jgi:hypothetical protein